MRAAGRCLVWMWLALCLPGSAMAGVVFHDSATHRFTGAAGSGISIGAYGITGGTASFSADITGSWNPAASFAGMIFNTTHGSPGPDLYVVQNFGGGCGTAGNFYWNSFDGCLNPFGALPGSVEDGSVHTVLVALDGTNHTTHLYYDNALVGAANYVAPGSFLTIGGAGNGTQGWNGTIGNFTVYDSVVTPAPLDAPGPTALAAAVLALLWLRRRGWT